MKHQQKCIECVVEKDPYNPRHKECPAPIVCPYSIEFDEDRYHLE